MSDKPRFSISVHGPGASIETAVQTAEAMKKLLAAVGKQMGVPEGAIEWQIGSVQFACDGCGLLRPDRPEPDEGWSFEDGNDFCPACTVDRETAA